ncbi:MAG TPA: hypothetical protein VFS54_02300 [Solirubrobacterales bacterium]|nr:hypothetical protein [Solirubrobacterales bacterium]
MRISASWKWIALALLGLLIAAGVAAAASQLASEQIGIASESVSAGDQLAPAVRQAASQTDRPSQPQEEEPPAEPETTTSESDDHGGDDDSGSDDHGGDDHGGDEDHSGHGGGGDDD